MFPKHSNLGNRNASLARHMSLEVKTYCGVAADPDFRVWLENFEMACALNNVSEADNIRYLDCLIQGPASLDFNSIKHRDRLSYTELRHRLLEIFNPPYEELLYRSELRKCKMSPDETLQEFYYRFHQLCLKPYPSGEFKTSTDVIDSFLGNVDEAIAKYVLKIRNRVALGTLQECFELAKDYQIGQRSFEALRDAAKDPGGKNHPSAGADKRQARKTSHSSGSASRNRSSSSDDECLSTSSPTLNHKVAQIYHREPTKLEIMQKLEKLSLDMKRDRDESLKRYNQVDFRLSRLEADISK